MSHYILSYSKISRKLIRFYKIIIHDTKFADLIKALPIKLEETMFVFDKQIVSSLLIT